MPTQVFTGGALYLGEYDFSGITKGFAFEIEVDAVDMSVIGSTTRINAAGLRGVTWNADLLYDATTFEESVFSYLNASGAAQAMLASFWPGGAVAEDELGYFLRTRPGQFGVPWTLGEAAMMSLSGDSGVLGGSRPGHSLVQARLSARGVAAASSGNGTGRQLGALASTKQWMAMAGHVTARTGTASVVFTLQSDDNSGFSSPTNCITQASINSVSDFGPSVVQGPITDDHWRVIYTISGTGTLSFVVAMGRIVLP